MSIEIRTTTLLNRLLNIYSETVQYISASSVS